jgi:hypothetical protein
MAEGDARLEAAQSAHTAAVRRLADERKQVQFELDEATYHLNAQRAAVAATGTGGSGGIGDGHDDNDDADAYARAAAAEAQVRELEEDEDGQDGGEANHAGGNHHPNASAGTDADTNVQATAKLVAAKETLIAAGDDAIRVFFWFLTRAPVCRAQLCLPRTVVARVSFCASFK